MHLGSIFFKLVATFTLTSSLLCEDHEYKSMASIRDLQFRHVCSGTILSDRWIMTAAHCLTDGLNLVVMVGDTRKDPKVFKADSIYTYPDYKPNQFINDIGLIKLASSISADENVEYVKLPSSNITIPMEEYCKISLVKSWANTERSIVEPGDLQCVNLEVTSPKSCEKQHFFFSHLKLKAERIICTESRKNKGGCNGDAGGPLLCGGIQVGIISWGLDCGSSSIPGVLTRVESYLDGINAALKQRSSLYEKWERKKAITPENYVNAYFYPENYETKEEEKDNDNKVRADRFLLAFIFLALYYVIA